MKHFANLGAILQKTTMSSGDLNVMKKDRNGGAENRTRRGLRIRMGSKCQPAALLYVVFAIGLLTLPALPYAGDPVAWREEGRAIVLHGRLSVEPDIAQHFGEPGQFFALNQNNGRYYFKSGIVNGPMTAIPLLAEYLLRGELPYENPSERICIFGVFYLLIAVAIAHLLHAITGHYSSNRVARIVYVLLAFYTTYLWNYLRSTSTESTLLLGFLVFCLCLLRLKRPGGAPSAWLLRDLYGAWAAVAFLVLTRLYFVLLAPVFAASLIYLARRGGLPRCAWVAFSLRSFIFPVVLILCAVGLVNQVKFGGPFLSGYHQWFDPPNPHTVWDVLYDFVFSIQWSFFVCFPPLLLALMGLRRFFRQHWDEAVFLLAVLGVFFAVVEPRQSWRGEWAYGSRYFVFILPLLALPALYPLEWACARCSKPAGALAVALLCLASAFMIFVQMEVNQLDFFFKYWAQLSLPAHHSRAAEEYFNHTSFPRINWDHIHADGHWEQLPYYSDLERAVPPETLTAWKAKIHSLVSNRNLYWFP